MKPNTKRNIKNVAKTGGKWALKEVKLAGKGTLTATELATKGIANIAESRAARKLLAGAGTIAATVAFAPAAISITALNYMFQNCILDKNYSATRALEATLGTTNRVLNKALGVVSVPTAAIARGTSKMAKKGKEALDR